MNFDQFNEDASLLQKAKKGKEIKVQSQLLRSNCKITYQPDWGNVYIYLKGNEIPTQSSLAKYLVSFRNENHFHEEICETIYMRLKSTFAPDELMVACLYTRRGGIDINPIRCSHQYLYPNVLHQATMLSKKHLRQ